MRLLKPGGRCGIVLPDGTLFGEGVKTRIKKQLLATCNLHTIIRLPNSVFALMLPSAQTCCFFVKGEQTNHIWYYEHQVPAGQKAYSMTRPITLEHLNACAKWWDKRRETECAWRVSVKEIEKRGYNLDIKKSKRQRIPTRKPARALQAVMASEKEAVYLRKQLHKALSDSLLK